MSTTQSLELKQQGNDKFAVGDIHGALKCYQAALKLDPTSVVLHSNAAQCLIQMNEWETSLEYAEKALVLDPNHLKSRVRRANAFKFLGLFEKSIADFRWALEKDPNNKTIKTELELVTSMLESADRADSEPIKAHEIKIDHVASRSSSTNTSVSKPFLEVENPTSTSTQSITTANTAPPNTDSGAMLPSTIPASTFPIFEVHWKQLHEHHAQFWSYLHQTGTSKLMGLIGSMMSSTMFSSLLSVIHHQLSDQASLDQDLQFATALFTSLSSYQRFTILKMMMSETDAQTAYGIIKSLQSRDQINLEEAAKLFSLWKYN